MSYTRMNNLNRVFAMILAVLMIVAMVPLYVFAGEENSSAIITDIGTKNFTVGKATEFTFTTIANDDAGKMVKGSFVFSDPSAIEKLEYRESKDGNWYTFNGDFGPESGFPMTDGATSTFRATFNKEGEFTVAVSMKTVPTDGSESTVLCSISETVNVSYVKGAIKTDIGNKVFAVNEPTEFTFETIANSDAGTLVYGMFESEDKDVISKLEYYEVKDGNWYEFDGKFGPEGGFPMTDGTSKFRVTFKEAGEYTFNAYVKNATTEAEVCSTSVTAKVDYVASELTSNIKDVSFVVGHPIEFTYTTDANSDLGKLVFGEATFDDATVVDKLEYYDVASEQWYEFDGKFGPEGGFPMADATSKFRVTFNKVGNYKVIVQMKGAADGETVLCSTEEEVVVEAAYANVETFTGGEIINNASGKVDVIVEETVLQWYPKDETIGRYQDGWWVGIKVTAPMYFSANAKYQTKSRPDAEYGDAKSFVANADGDNKDYIEIWFPVSPESLTKFANEKRDLVMTYGFNWDGDADNIIEQVVTFTVKPSAKIVLMQGDAQKYPFATVETLTGGNVTADGSASVEVFLEGGVFQCVEKNEAIGRYQDGWWAGINVIAPAYFNEDAKYVVKGNRNDAYDFDNAKSFVSNRDSENSIGLWFPLSPELFASFANKDYDPTLCYSFDWDGNGEYEQEIFFTVSRTGEFVLMKGDVQKYPDSIPPKVEVSWVGLDDDSLVKDTVVATVTITERNESFDANAATDAVKQAIKAGNYVISEWDTTESTVDLDEDVHKATVTFAEQGTYSFEMTEYADACGNAAVTYPEKCDFVIDKTAPTGDIAVDGISILNRVWNAVTFNLFNNKPVKITISYEDDFSGIEAENVYYYIHSATDILDEKNIADLRLAWMQYDEENKPVISPNAMGRVYVMLVDNAGNAKYLNSRGVVAEMIGGEGCISVELSGASGKYTSTVHGSEVYYYNESAEDYGIKININEYLNVDDISSGFKKISYWFNNGDEMIEDTFKEIEFTSDATYDELVKIWDETVTINRDWNSSDISFWISVEDNAGNGYGKVVYIDIDVVAPKIEVVVDGVYTQEGFKLGHDNNFESATATVTITEREKHFNKEAATEAVKNGIAAVDGKGEAVSDAFGISEWEMITGNTPDETKFIATVTFEKNAKYTVKVTYADALGNEGVSEENAFCIDTVEPKAYINVGEESIIRLIFDVLTFGVFDANTVTVTIDAEDELSGVNKIFYYVSDKTEHDADEKEYLVYEKGIEVSPDAIASLYVIAVDNAGNEWAVNSDGIIVEDNKSNIDIKPQAAEGEYLANKDSDRIEETVYYYNASSQNYNVDITVDETGISSGIKKVTYSFFNGDEEIKNTYTEITDGFVGEGSTYDELVKSWKHTVAIDKTWNSSDLSLWVKVEDNAGNVHTEVIYIDVDATLPTVKVEYADKLNTHPGAENTPVEGYFSERVATITITERTNHFSAEEATKAIEILVKDGEIANYEIVKQEDADGNLVEWLTVEGATPDEDTHTAIIKYSDASNTDADGAGANYSFDIVYTDFVNNTDVDDNKATFTVDNTDPTGTATAETFGVWNKLLEILTFGIWTSNDVTVTANGVDEISDIHSIYTYTQNLVDKKKAPLTFDELEAVEKWDDYSESVKVERDSCVSVYFKIVDNAGNYIYINTDGIIVDSTTSEIEIIPENTTVTLDGVPVYNEDHKDIEVTIKVTEPDGGSGINKITYTVESKINNNKVEGELYAATLGTNPAYDELLLSFEETIKVSAELFNACDTVVTVEVIDNANNPVAKSQRLDIDKVDPQISVEYTVNDKNERALPDYYTKREAVVTIVERTHHFDPIAATNGIKITAVDAEGKAVANAYTISEWDTVEGRTPDEAVHKAKVTFVKDANYTFYVEYSDMAGNKGEATKTSVFTVDTTAATGTVTVTGTDDRAEWTETRNELINKDEFDFELWSRVPVIVSGTSYDATSLPVQSMMYYKTDLTVALEADELAALDESAWTEFKDFTVEPNEQFTVYVRLIDNAGNISYISTSGVIADSIAPVVRDVLPVITITPEQPVNGIYSSDVKVDVKVTESKFNEVYSGLKNIRYEIYNMGVLTQSGDLVNYDNTGDGKADLVTEWSKNAAIIVDKKLNNSNDVEIRVYATDNAGNKHNKSEFIKIDITAPVIDITYDNNDCDKTYNESAYFDADRTATIVITERNFNPADVIVTITNTDGVIPVITDFVTVAADGNGDGTTHTAKISYTADGDYTFDISFKDKAGLAATEINHHSEASKEFTIDKTLPVISITYDNNSYENGYYYSEARTVFIKVTEHNFDPARFIPTTVAQGMSQWTSVGDVHTATISFLTDGDYTFNYTFADKARNESAVYNGDRFIIDSVKPEVTIIDNVKETAPEERGAYNGDINFTVSYSDIYVNANRVDVKLEDSNGKDYDFSIDNGTVEGTTVTKLFVDTLENDILPDGIYTLAVTVYDMAGNGSTVTKLFSVNRDSSNFVMDLYLGELVNNKYNKEVDKDFVISEINCDKITGTEITIIHNGETKVLKEGEDYTVEHKGYSGDWNQYDYTVFAQNFEDDGNYSIVIKSSDEAGNTVDNLTATGEFKKTIEFSVDDTAPVIMVNGLDKDSDQTKVTAFITYEDNISVDKVIITVTVKGEKTADSHEYVIEGEELNALSDRIEHIINQAKAKQEITIKVIDKAGNVSEEIVKRITINPNWLIRFVNNTPVFVGSICAVVVLIAAAIIIPVILKKKGKKTK